MPVIESTAANWWTHYPALERARLDIFLVNNYLVSQQSLDGPVFLRTLQRHHSSSPVCITVNPAVFYAYNIILNEKLTTADAIILHSRSVSCTPEDVKVV